MLRYNAISEFNFSIDRSNCLRLLRGPVPHLSDPRLDGHSTDSMAPEKVPPWLPPVQGLLLRVPSLIPETGTETQRDELHQILPERLQHRR